MDISEIQSKASQNKIFWSKHSALRFLQRGIKRDDVLACVNNGEIIEEYPDAYLTPACLICGKLESGKTIHVVVGLDENVHIVTAYFPTEKKFIPPEFKKRRS